MPVCLGVHELRGRGYPTAPEEHLAMFLAKRAVALENSRTPHLLRLWVLPAHIPLLCTILLAVPPKNTLTRS